MTTTSESKSSSLAGQLAGVSHYVTALPRGQRAELRRLDARRGSVPPDAFWRIVDRYDIPPRDEDYWMDVLPLMVRHPHRKGGHPGAVLRASGLSAPRLERWLRLDVNAARREARRVLSHLEGGVDWVELGRLLFWWGERDRRRLARDYFLVRTDKNISDEEAKR